MIIDFYYIFCILINETEWFKMKYELEFHIQDGLHVIVHTVTTTMLWLLIYFYYKISLIKKRKRLKQFNKYKNLL